MGAPAILTEKLFNGNETTLCLNTMQRMLAAGNYTLYLYMQILRKLAIICCRNAELYKPYENVLFFYSLYCCWQEVILSIPP